MQHSGLEAVLARMQTTIEVDAGRFLNLLCQWTRLADHRILF